MMTQSGTSGKPRRNHFSTGFRAHSTAVPTSPKREPRSLPCLDSLKDKSPEVRATSIRVLSGLTHQVNARSRSKERANADRAKAPDLVNDTVCSKAFLELVSDTDDLVREAAVSALGELAGRSPSAPPEPVVAALNDKSPIVKAAVARTLPKYREHLDPIIPILLSALGTEDTYVKDAYSNALSQIQPSAAMAPMLTAALASPHREIRLRAAGGLGRIGRKSIESVPRLVKLLGETAEDDLVHPKKILLMGQGTDSQDPACAAARSLSAICPHTDSAAVAVAGLTEMLGSPHDWRRAAAADALVAFGADAQSALPRLVATLKSATAQNQPTKDGDRCARAIGQIGPRSDSDAGAIEALTDALDAPDTDLKNQAASALGRFGKKAAVAIPNLRPLLTNRNFGVRTAAAKALTAWARKRSCRSKISDFRGQFSLVAVAGLAGLGGSSLRFSRSCQA